ncbi:MAG: hypothetical protein QXP36_11700 [Conexivisphaerales archaeon]
MKLKKKPIYMTERESRSASITLTEAQFRELKQLLESYLKVTALGALELTKTEIEKDTWLLNAAGFSQDTICKILHTSKTTVSQILKGKYVARKRREEGEK